MANVIWADAAVVRKGGHQSALHKRPKTGWAYVVMDNSNILEYRLGRLDNTADSVKVELHAVIEALSSEYARNIDINTDCQHVAKLFQGFDIKYAEKASVIKARNKALELNVKIVWIESHKGDIGAIHADTFARQAIGLSPASFWGHI